MYGPSLVRMLTTYAVSSSDRRRLVLPFAWRIMQWADCPHLHHKKCRIQTWPYVAMYGRVRLGTNVTCV